MITPIMFPSRLEDLFNKISFYSILFYSILFYWMSRHTHSQLQFIFITLSTISYCPSYHANLSHLLTLPQSFIILAISHAMARDGSSGGVIRLVTIDKDGVEKEVILGKYIHAYLH